MTDNDLEVRRMQEEDIDGAINTIWLAFEADPYAKFIFNRTQVLPS